MVNSMGHRRPAFTSDCKLGSLGSSPVRSPPSPIRRGRTRTRSASTVCPRSIDRHRRAGRSSHRPPTDDHRRPWATVHPTSTSPSQNRCCHSHRGGRIHDLARHLAGQRDDQSLRSARRCRRGWPNGPVSTAEPAPSTGSRTSGTRITSLPKEANPRPVRSVCPSRLRRVVQAGPAHLPPPAPIVPLASPPIPGEGQWSPAGRLVDGIPAVYETTLRPDPVHTSYVVGVAWMDTKLLKATLYSGSIIPGGGPFTHTAPIGNGAAGSLVAAFNAGFLMSAANGGYYTDGKTIIPLQTGAASFVVYANGSATVGAWGTDVSMRPERRLGPTEPRPPGRRRTARRRSRRRRHHQVGRNPRQCRLRLAVGSRRYRRRCARLRGRPRSQHHRSGRSPGPGRRRAGDGARHQHRLGQLLHLPSQYTAGPGDTLERDRAPARDGRITGTVFRVMVGT